MCLYKDLFRDVHSGITHNGKIVETTQVPVSGLMDKQSVYPYNRIVVIHIEEGCTDSCYVDEPQKYSTIWKEPDIKKNHDSIY